MDIEHELKTNHEFRQQLLDMTDEQLCGYLLLKECQVALFRHYTELLEETSNVIPLEIVRSPSTSRVSPSVLVSDPANVRL